MFWRLRRSGWGFTTSRGYAESVSVVGPVSVGSGAGQLFFKNPVGSPFTFNYEFIQAGVGISGIDKLIGMSSLRNELVKNILKNFNFSGSVKRTFSEGWIYMSEDLARGELSPPDFEGVCLIEEIAVSAIKGGALTIIYFGMPLNAAGLVSALNLSGTGILDLAPSWSLGPVGYLWQKASVSNKPKAALVMLSNNWGYQLGAGLSQSLGSVWLGARPYLTVADLFFEINPPTVSKEDVSIRSSITQDDGIFIPSDVLFPFDRPKPSEMPIYGFNPAAKVALDKAAKYIAKRNPNALQIYGHTDWLGGDQYNLDLSDRRAAAVKAWLLSNQIPGFTNRVLAESQIYAKGKGESEPIADNRSRQGRRQNRRVEMLLKF